MNTSLLFNYSFLKINHAFISQDYLTKLHSNEWIINKNKFFFKRIVYYF